jgi:predicted GNAT family N-acyltransferase
MRRGSDVALPIRITNLRNDGKSNWIQCRFAGETDIEMEHLARLVLYNDKTTSFPDLWRAGFRVRDVHNLLEYQVVSSDAEFQQILDLRLRAEAPQVRKYLSPDKLEDHWDRVAEHIYATLAFRVVAAARLFFPSSAQAVSEHHRLFERLPKQIWDQGFLEVSRLIVDPEFRGTSLLETLIQHILFVALQSQQRFVIMAVVEPALRLFESLGAKAIGTSYVRESYDARQRVSKQTYVAICFDLNEQTALQPQDQRAVS